MNTNRIFALPTALVTLSCVATLFYAGCKLDPISPAAETISETGSESGSEDSESGESGSESGGDIEPETGDNADEVPQPLMSNPCTSLVDACCLCLGVLGDAPMCAAWGGVNAASCADVGGEYVTGCVLITFADAVDGPACFGFDCV